MKINLIDKYSETYETTFGSCEMCFYTGRATETQLKFRYEDGTTEWVDTFLWSWGSLFEIEIENLADFAHWLNEQDFDDNYRIREYSDLQELVHDYEKDWDETEED